MSLENETTSQREHVSLLSIKDNHEKWIVSMDELPFNDNAGIKYIPAWQLSDALQQWSQGI